VTLARAALLFTLLANGAFGAEPAGGEPAAIARQTVAAALGIPAADVRILRVEAREFRDGSLDCPQTGTAYAQVITPGHQVLAEAGGRRFDVRIAGTAGRICHRRRPAAPGQAPPPARETGAAARADLAAHLGIPPADVAVTFLRRLRPGEAVPGCGVPCPADALQTTCPVGIRLKAGDRGYEYVSGPEGPRPCPPIAPR
jgi:hypothetical protein